ncbi:hypothetical protein C0992_005081 [Termitomyces sp. T32_za158]|nr:hypothetical protein C0992_005081 [Termitomyces sp. T32_za158]
MDAYLQQNVDDIQRLLASTDNTTFVLGSALTAPPGKHRSEQFKSTIHSVSIRLCKILSGDVDLIQPWRSCTASPDIAEHLNNLKVPTIDGKPSLLLHRLGETSKDSFHLEEPKLRAKRLENIFIKGSSTYGLQHSVLFNTSGAGKTRLVLEGLCKEWGFYFTCKRDVSECGSADLDRVLDPAGHGYLRACGLIEHPDSDIVCSNNEAQAERCFMAVLVGRLIVFQCLLAAYEVQGKKATLAELRRIWLFVQLDSRLLADSNCPDLLLELTTLLCHMPKNAALPSRGYKMLGECRLFLRTLASCNGLLPPGDGQVPIFCVVDEVQSAAHLFPQAFRGGPTGKDPRPALRALLKTWSIGMRFVVTGTSLNIQHIRDAVSSTVGKVNGHIDHAINGTGSFIHKHEQIDNYLDYYLPSLYLNSAIGKELARRARYWLVGRPRFVASFVQYLMIHNYQSCHKLLTSYIQAITKFSPTDGTHWEQLEDSMPETMVLPAPFNFEKAAALDVQSRNALITSIQGLVNHRLLRGRTDFETSGEGLVDSKLVECGFARYPDGKGLPATFDEPLAYLAADTWISSYWFSRHHYFLQRINHNSPEQNGLERYTAICLAHIFRQFTPLSIFFRFARKLGKPKRLEKKRARLVSCWIDSNEEFRVAPVVFPFDNEVDQSYGHVIQGTSSPSNILGYTSTKPSDDLQWLNFEVNAPFLFPDESFGPDLMFRLQLEEGKLLTVALQVKYREQGTTLTKKEEMKRAVKSVNPSKFWTNNSQINGKASAPKSHPNLHTDTLNALDKLENRYRPNRGGYHSMIGGLFAYPATDNEATCNRILEKLTKGEIEFNAAHEFFMIPTAPIIQLTDSMPPFGGLKRMEDAMIQRRVLEKLHKLEFTNKVKGRKRRGASPPVSGDSLVKR